MAKPRRFVERGRSLGALIEARRRASEALRALRRFPPDVTALLMERMSTTCCTCRLRQTRLEIEVCGFSIQCLWDTAWRDVDRALALGWALGLPAIAVVVKAWDYAPEDGAVEMDSELLDDFVAGLDKVVLDYTGLFRA